MVANGDPTSQILKKNKYWVIVTNFIALKIAMLKKMTKFSLKISQTFHFFNQKSLFFGSFSEKFLKFFSHHWDLNSH
jgi:hypothetical protein